MTGRLIGLSRSLIRLYERRRLTGRRLVLVSNNCWGYELYRTLSRPYDTPFVGVYIHPDCYLSLLRRRFPDDLRIRSCSFTSEREGGAVSHPVGRLSGGEEIHFLHYPESEQAVAIWHRRGERMREALGGGAVFAVKFCDRDGATAEDFAAFHALGFERSVSLSANTPLPRSTSHHLFDPGLIDPVFPRILDGVNLYWARYRYFDITSWLRFGSLNHTLISRVFRLFT